MTTPKSRLERWAPIWSMALRANRLLKAERLAHKETRHDLAIARACQATSAEELVDANARIRHLDGNIQLLVNHRFQAFGEAER